jgi:hypothetical protein
MVRRDGGTNEPVTDICVWKGDMMDVQEGVQEQDLSYD